MHILTKILRSVTQYLPYLISSTCLLRLNNITSMYILSLYIYRLCW